MNKMDEVIREYRKATLGNECWVFGFLAAYIDSEGYIDIYHNTPGSSSSRKIQTFKQEHFAIAFIKEWYGEKITMHNSRIRT